ncbi:CxxH/CxxC protein [Bacillus taeanensis]|uniref:CxxH/CxxC protein n=1 Tax=Bacillus taeanensis TaxID=273032 RepID=A0A366XVD8_9BACI|nr:CxxH/CxxC protein [Bacillus taeanensis]RBW69115.1 CxxH/CxxC protein [Bacillus taeanensis]
MIYCCKEHIELALDYAVDKWETPPVLEEFTNDTKDFTKCEFCQNEAAYVVSN